MNGEKTWSVHLAAACVFAKEASRNKRSQEKVPSVSFERLQKEGVEWSANK